MFGQRLAHDQAGDPAGELDDLDAALDRRPRLGQRLAVLARDQAGELLGVRGEPLAEPEHHPRPLDDRRLGPGRQRRGGRLHGAIDLVGRAERDRGDRRCPFEGLYTGPKRADRLASQRPPIEHLDAIAGLEIGLGRGHRECLRGRDSSDILTSNRPPQVGPSPGIRSAPARPGWNPVPRSCSIVTISNVLVARGVVMSRIVRGGLIQATLCEPATSPVAVVKKAMIDKHVALIAEAAEQGAQVVCLQELFYGPYFCAEQQARVVRADRARPRRPDDPADVPSSPGSTRSCWSCRSTRRT